LDWSKNWLTTVTDQCTSKTLQTVYQSNAVYAQAGCNVRESSFNEDVLLCSQSVEAVLTAYVHDVSTYARVRDLLDFEMDKGLSKTFHKKSALKMLITYVRDLPNGSGYSM
jgi:hypothetical protein